MSEPAPAAPIRSLPWTVLGALGRALAAIARAVHRFRGPLGALLARGVFWGALLLWCTSTMTLVGGGAIDLAGTTTRFVLGAAACAVVTLTSDSARMRWLTAVVGSLHGIGAVTLWLLV